MQRVFLYKQKNLQIVSGIVLIIGGAAIFGEILSAIMSGMQPDINSLSTGLMTSGPILAIGAILWIIAALILPMAIAKWLKAGNIGAALNVKDVIKNALSVEYIITLLVLTLYINFFASMDARKLIFSLTGQIPHKISSQLVQQSQLLPIPYRYSIDQPRPKF